MRSDPPKSKRRRFQFSLRTLLALLLVGTLVLGGRVRRAAKNRERVTAARTAVAEIHKLGGYAVSDDVERRSATWIEQLLDDPGGWDDPVRVVHVSYVHLFGAKETDTALKHLRGITNVEFLNLEHSNVTNSGLEHITGVTTLEGLVLENTQITDAGLEHLKGLTNLKQLVLKDTKVTDASVEKLQQALPNCNIPR